MDQQPRRRDADRSRAEILDAAERLFAADGFEAVTMAQIGAAAGLSRGTPGYFFGQKEQLYRIVLERAAATFRMLGETLRLRDAAGERDRETLLHETVEAFVGLLVARRDVVRLLDRDAGATVGSPHIDAVNEALSRLGPDRSALVLTVATLAWYPVAHPEAAAVLGVDVAAPDFSSSWARHIVGVVDAGAVAEPAWATVAPLPAEPTSAAPPPSLPTADGDGVSPDGAAPPETAEQAAPADPDARFVSEVVVDELKKKKKKKKGKKRRDADA